MIGFSATAFSAALKSCLKPRAAFRLKSKRASHRSLGRRSRESATCCGTSIIVSDRLIWNVVQVNLPPLKAAVLAIEAELKDDL